MPCPSDQEGQSVRSHPAGCGGERPHDSSWPYRKGLITRIQGGRANWPDCPWQTAHFEAWGGCPLRRIGPHAEETATSIHWVYLFMGGWVWFTPLRGCRLTSKYIPGGMIGSELLGVPAGDHLPLYHDRGGIIPVPIQDHFLDIPAAGPVQTLRPAQIPSVDWRTLNKCNTPLPTYEQIQCSLTNPWVNGPLLNPWMNCKSSEYLLLKWSRT